jgi:tRNA(Ile)-lysidine synthase
MTQEIQIGNSAAASLVGIVARVRETIDRHRLLVARDRVLVACSGGPDSVALLALLLRSELDLELVVGHVDHGLREDSAADAEAVAALADREGLAFVQRKLRLGGGEPRRRPSELVSEDTARRARLAALEEMSLEVGAVPVALGHTADDQLETLVMRLCRGAGLTGFSGMAPQRGRFVRPLLDLGRSEVLATLEVVGWSAREDPTNRSARYFRNRVRRDVVPLLKRENPRLLEGVTRSARGLREALEALEHYEALEWRRLARTSADGGGNAGLDAVDRVGMEALPPGLASRLVRRLWRVARGRPDPGGGGSGELTRDHVEAVLALLDRDTGPRLDLPGGVVAYRQYDLLVVAPAARLVDPGDVSVEVGRPGVYPLPELGLLLEVEAESDAPTVDPGSLRVRNLRTGDRLAVQAGSRKLSDLLVDRKIPRWQRRRLALVIWKGEIVWIPGVWRKDGVDTKDGDGTMVVPELRVQLRFREVPADQGNR